MPDFIDNTTEDLGKEHALAMRINSEKVKQIPVGEEGECARCGEHSLRLVKDTCARCRDKFKLP